MRPIALILAGLLLCPQPVRDLELCIPSPARWYSVQIGLMDIEWRSVAWGNGMRYLAHSGGREFGLEYRNDGLFRETLTLYSNGSESLDVYTARMRKGTLDLAKSRPGFLESASSLDDVVNILSSEFGIVPEHRRDDMRDRNSYARFRASFAICE